MKKKQKKKRTLPRQVHLQPENKTAKVGKQ